MSSLSTEEQVASRPSPDQPVEANIAVDAEDAGDVKTPTTPRSSSAVKNAFHTLMSSPSRKAPEPGHQSKKPKTKADSSQRLTRPGRNGLGAYLAKPTGFGSAVLYHNDKFVVIKDMYPKSAVHLLLLPRTERNILHPFTAFQDQDLLDTTRAEAAKVKTLAAEELRRMYGRFSEKNKARREAIASGLDDVVPAGRDWEKEIIIGIHAGPSMNHLHVHVLSRDRVSHCMKHRKHYNSFNTSFFVGLDELPLSKDDPRWAHDRGGGLSEDLTCWRCGQKFGNKFERLKGHLAEEFERWKQE